MTFKSALQALTSLPAVARNRAERKLMVHVKRQVKAYTTRADRKYGYTPGTMFGKLMGVLNG